MAYIAKQLVEDPEGFKNKYEGKLFGTGHCVPLVQDACNAPTTSLWKRGEQVRGSLLIKTGTAIATFGEDGTYKNKTDGTSHAAIYIQQDGNGIQVWDQWQAKAGGADTRWIRFEPFGKDPRPVNDGDNYNVID